MWVQRQSRSPADPYGVDSPSVTFAWAQNHILGVSSLGDRLACKCSTRQVELTAQNHGIIEWCGMDAI